MMKLPAARLQTAEVWQLGEGVKESEWADILARIEQAGSEVRAIQIDALKVVVGRLEALVRRSLDELELSRDEADAALAARRAAEARLKRLDGDLKNAEELACQAHQRALEAKGMLKRVKAALNRHLGNPNGHFVEAATADAA